MANVRYLTAEELEVGLETIRQSPSDEGVLELIVRRPAVDERELLAAAELDPLRGLVGDRWKPRGGKFQTQLTLMNSRAIGLIAQEKDRRPLAGDQLYVDFDLSHDNLPAGARLAIGPAVVEISGVPHTGCNKFAARFGPEAVAFVNSAIGKQLRLRGVNARVIQGGAIRIGDAVRKAAGYDKAPGQ
jgi:MOSC domain-containing protein YiiM